MNISNKQIWQQACGDTDRNYADICIKWDVILNGPGYAGPYPDCISKLYADGASSKKVTDIGRFAQSMKDGDLVVLRLGTAHILGVGEIIGDYQYSDLFGDVDGWDLQHVRRVKWYWHNLQNPKIFPTYSLKQGDTTQILSSDRYNVRQWLQELEVPISNDRNVKEFPQNNPQEVKYDEIAEYLYDQGTASHSIETLIKEFDELKMIARWYRKQNPSEFETVAYLAVPLLRSLGWTPQKMAIEWYKVDIALFDRLPRNDTNLAVVVEAKKKGYACLTAKSQAQGYAEGKDNCNRLIVTDGLRYGTYIKQKGQYKLYAYMNLTELKESYPIYECHGVKEALTVMTPEWNGEIKAFKG